MTPPQKLPASIKLAIGCPSHLFGEGLQRLLEDEKDIQVTGVFNEAVDFKEIIKMKPDLAILDFGIFSNLPNDLMRENEIKMLLIGERSFYSVSDRRVADLISKGVVGILPSAADSALLKKAIRAVSSGELWLDRKTISNILSHNSSSKKEKIRLTGSEREVVALICEGYRNKEIAQKLHITEKTVKSHCNRIYKKVGVSDRLQLATHIYKVWPDWYRLRH